MSKYGYHGTPEEFDAYCRRWDAKAAELGQGVEPEEVNAALAEEDRAAKLAKVRRFLKSAKPVDLVTADRMVQDVGQADASELPIGDGQAFLPLGGDAVSDSGGLLTNRPPVNRICEDGALAVEADTLAEPRRSTGGEDRFEISAHVTWRHWESFRKKLAAAKEAAESIVNGADEGLRERTFVGKWAVLSRGAKAGTEQNGPVYAYQLKAEGVLLAIANRAEGIGHFANVRIIVESLPLICDDARNVWARIVADINALGGQVVKALPSRVDVCVDVVGVNVSEFTEKFRARHYVTKAKKNREFGEFQIFTTNHRDTGLWIGSGIMLRIYDKLEECKNDPVKLAAMRAHRWQLPEPCDALPSDFQATRVEFQVRREELKTMGVDTIEDWFDKRASACAYLTEKWFRFTERLPDRKNGNQAAAAASALWLRVTEIFREWVGMALCVMRRVAPCRIDLKQHRAQVLGLVTSAYAFKSKYLPDIEELAEFGADFIRQCISERSTESIWKRTDKKRLAFLAAVPDGFGFADAAPESFDSMRARVDAFFKRT